MSYIFGNTVNSTRINKVLDKLKKNDEVAARKTERLKKEVEKRRKKTEVREKDIAENLARIQRQKVNANK